MELTGVALRRSAATVSPMVLRDRRRRNPDRVRCVGRGFGDEGHLLYYEAPPRRKAVEAVAKDLAKIRAMGFVAGDAAKEKILAEATELLLQELNQMKDDEDEMKSKRKEEKAAMKALKKQQKEAKKKAAMAMNCDEESSESSESECEEQLMKMGCVATATAPQIGQGTVIPMAVPQIAASGDIATGPGIEYDKAAMKAMKKREKEQKKAAKKAMKMKKEEMKMAALSFCKDEDTSSESSDSECGEVVRMSRCGTMTMPQTQPSSAVFPIIVPQIPGSVVTEPFQGFQISSEPSNAMQRASGSIAVAEKPMLTNRIEVCVGGKCKKSGSLALLQEFEKNVGTDGAVIGCKCMGKCGLGPNVRLRSGASAQGSATKNPLCIGVGLEDVGTIVTSFFGDNDDLGNMMAT